MISLFQALFYCCINFLTLFAEPNSGRKRHRKRLKKFLAFHAKLKFILLLKYFAFVKNRFMLASFHHEKFIFYVYKWNFVSFQSFINLAGIKVTIMTFLRNYRKIKNKLIQKILSTIEYRHVSVWIRLFIPFLNVRKA